MLRVPSLGERVERGAHALVDAHRRRRESQLWARRRFIGITHAREGWNLASERALVVTLGIPLDCNAHIDIHERFEKRDALRGVARPNAIAVGSIGANQTRDRDRARLCKQQRRFARASHSLGAASGIEGESGIESVPERVAVEDKRGTARRNKCSFKSERDRRLARGR